MMSIDTNFQRFNELIEEGEQLEQKIAEFKENKAKNERKTRELSETLKGQMCEELISNGDGKITDEMIADINKKYPNPKIQLTMKLVAEHMTELKKQGKIEAEAFVCHQERLFTDNLINSIPKFPYRAQPFKDWTDDVEYWTAQHHVVLGFRNIQVLK